jgi:hypothetical protein
MLITFDNAEALINDGKLLHIAGTESLLRKLPKGKWIGGSTEYFMAKDGGKITGELLYVTEFPYGAAIKSYDADSIKTVAADAYDNGFSLVIVPFDSAVHKFYAKNASDFEGMFIKNVAGWVSGLNLGSTGQTPIAVNGETGEILTDKAAVMHLEVPADKTVGIDIVNIFEQDDTSPLIEFIEGAEGFSVKKCLIDGKEVVFADYLAENGIDTKLPLVGDYSGSGVNISFKSVEDGVVSFYAPVFSGIKYRMAKGISDYAGEFNGRLAGLDGTKAVFSCNCILNFLYGELEGKNLSESALAGPITFGEIAYQLVNQTLVYVTVS